jgi:hypothetical protein
MPRRHPLRYPAGVGRMSKLSTLDNAIYLLHRKDSRVPRRMESELRTVHAGRYGANLENHRSSGSRTCVDVASELHQLDCTLRLSCATPASSSSAITRLQVNGRWEIPPVRADCEWFRSHASSLRIACDRMWIPTKISHAGARSHKSMLLSKHSWDPILNSTRIRG